MPRHGCPIVLPPSVPAQECRHCMAATSQGQADGRGAWLLVWAVVADFSCRHGVQARSGKGPLRRGSTEGSKNSLSAGAALDLQGKALVGHGWKEKVSSHKK